MLIRTIVPCDLQPFMVGKVDFTADISLYTVFSQKQAFTETLYTQPQKISRTEESSQKKRTDFFTIAAELNILPSASWEITSENNKPVIFSSIYLTLIGLRLKNKVLCLVVTYHFSSDRVRKYAPFLRKIAETKLRIK